MATPTAMPSRTIVRVVSRRPSSVDQRRVQAHLLDGGAAVAEQVEGPVGAVRAHPAAARNARRPSSAAGSQVTARVNRSAIRVSTPACSSRDPWPAPRLCGSTVRSVISPSETGSQSGSAAGPVTTNAGHQVALEADQHPVAGVGRAGQGESPALGDLLGVEVGEHLGGQQVGVRRRARRAPARRRSPWRRRTRRPGRRRRLVA